MQSTCRIFRWIATLVIYTMR